VDVAKGNQLWGEQYSRDMADIVSVQNHIAREITNALRLKLTSTQEEQLAAPETPVGEAYQAYWKGRFHWNRRTNEDFKRAVAFFGEAIQQDPEYAPALLNCRAPGRRWRRRGRKEAHRRR